MIAEPRLPRALLVPLTILAWLAVLIVVGWLLSHVVRTLLVVVLAAVIAFAVSPLVNLFDRFLPRQVALAVAYLLALVVIIGLVGVVVVTVAAQTSSLVHELPTYAAQANQLEPRLDALVAPFGIKPALISTLRDELLARVEAIGGTAASDLFGLARQFVGTLADVVLVLMLSVYFVSGAPHIRGWVQEHIPSSQRRRVRVGTGILNQVVGGYVRGTLTMAVIIGVLVGVGMGVLQVRYAVLLGVVAFFMAFVPILGTLISGTLCVLVALFQGPLLALLVLAYFVGVHVLESDVIGPRVLGSALGIHPAVALIAFLAGTELFGFWGALFGAPLAGLLQAAAVAGWREYRAATARVVEVAPAEADLKPRRRR